MAQSQQLSSYSQGVSPSQPPSQFQTKSLQASQSQLTLPADLPFRVISKTIGQGAYAFIRKAIPLEQSEPVFAVKFIHKASAIKHGRITAKQLLLEVSLHHHIGFHQNIVQLFDYGQDANWQWVAMELAEGGDLFDKIEADEGVGEDIAHFYFTQLIGAVSFMHSKHVAHRDIKPENILLSASGDLKLADFGLATLTRHKGHVKPSTFICGSPPYIAPEVLACGSMSRTTHHSGAVGYLGDLVDIWSSGVVLFVLLVGNTPWDQPTEASPEFQEYLETNGRTTDTLWDNLPPETLSLLRGMMRVDPASRFTLEDIRRHPWFTRPNPYMSPNGRVNNPVSLATKMLESLKIDLNKPFTASQSTQASDNMDTDGFDLSTKLASTQPETPVSDMLFDWERPARMEANDGWKSWDRLVEDPTLSQFSATPTVPLSLTQHAQRFRDIVPSHSLTRFLSHLSFSLLLPLISEALGRLGVPVSNIPQSALEGREDMTWIKIVTVDGRACGLRGDVVVERMWGDAEGLLEVRFIKAKGDPLEWRRFFKKVVVLCKDGVYIPQ
ncbi:serine/threonine-protein kinase chk1 [Xylona heveae TC161]|uniref:Serine/threonine-protein kinase chk1 n=1 Tax=Xylona heveae (strain CBS 132557 / TC161) TaxID=1328760 RepID=A0A165GFJ8_XYLHT|nr:serine/threonine-protein kinase chk1 [Xylona heveae TC161]KZF22123.1 serine/threonine-protein kinase chk1 [Xylona heveae TC161]